MTDRTQPGDVFVLRRSTFISFLVLAVDEKAVYFMTSLGHLSRATEEAYYLRSSWFHLNYILV